MKGRGGENGGWIGSRSINEGVSEGIIMVMKGVGKDDWWVMVSVKFVWGEVGKMEVGVGVVVDVMDVGKKEGKNVRVEGVKEKVYRVGKLYNLGGDVVGG